MERLTFLNFFLVLFFSLFSTQATFSQSFEDVKKQFKRDLQSGDIQNGCEIMVSIILDGSEAACFIPEPSISKVACAIATIYKGGGPAGEEVIKEAGSKVCTIGVASAKTVVTYTLKFAKDTGNEIEETYNWFNSMDGVTWLMYNLTK